MTNPKTFRRARILTLAGAGAMLAGIALTACGTAHPAATGAAPATTSNPPSSSLVPANPTATASASTPAAPAPVALKFANKTPFVELTGYDATNAMVEFRVVNRYQSENIQDHFTYDQTDPAVHRLPLAAKAVVNLTGGGIGQFCPAAPHCSAGDLVLELRHGTAVPLLVQLVVDTHDTVTMVNQQVGALI